MNFSPGLPDCGFIRMKRLIGPDGIYPVSRAYLYELIRRGVFPAPEPLAPGSRIVGFRVEAVRAFLAHTSTEPNDRRTPD